MNLADDDDFWNFSCAIYEDLRERLLFLQDEAGLNINMLLLCGWLGRGGYRLHDMAGSCFLANRWESEFVAPLRTVRRRAKAQDEALYEATKRLELQFEHACQRALQGHVSDLVKNAPESNKVCVSENIGDYLDYARKGTGDNQGTHQKASCIDEAVRAIILRLEEF